MPDGGRFIAVTTFNFINKPVEEILSLSFTDEEALRDNVVI